MSTLYVKQKVFKITDHYRIFDENQTPVYQVDQDFKLVGNTVHVSNLHGQEIFVVNKIVFTLLPKYEVKFSDGREVLLQSRLALLRKKIDVLPEDMGILLEGNVFDYDFTISKYGNMIGRIRKEILAWGDTYEITVYDERYQDLVVALMIAVDCIKDSQRNST